MCGFVGLINPSEDSQNILVNLEKSRNLIAHRGKDSQRIFSNKNIYLAFNRLAIVDLDKRSDQPMQYCYKSKKILGMLNGEIYNFHEIKRNLISKGFKFNTNSDTEVFLALFLDKGINCLNELNGIFSAFVFLEKENTAFLIRDQIGVKPLYYVEKHLKYNFIFASEIKAFKSFLKLKPNIKALSEFSCFGENAEEQTIYEDIYQVKPGSYIEINLDKNFLNNQKNYFSLANFYNTNISNIFEESSDLNEFKETFEESLLKQITCEVPTGIEFSGGLDSSLLACIASQLKEINSYSVTIPGFDINEEYWQDRVLKLISIENKKFSIKNESFDSENLNHLIFLNDAPLQHPNFLPCYSLCKKAKKDNIKVMLSGDGADEFFSGYKWLEIDQKHRRSSDIIINSAFNNLEKIENLFNQTIDIFPRVNYLNQIKGNSERKNFLLRSHLYFQRFYLQKWLHRQDRTGMSNGIEIRVPYCDFRLITKYLKIRLNSLEEICGSKTDLKKMAENFLPKEIIYRKKIGFPLPLEDIFLENGFLGNISLLLLKKKYLSYPEIINPKIASKLAFDHLNKKAKNGRILWTIYNTELWLRLLFKDS